MKSLSNRVKMQGQQGQGLTEYAIVLSLVALAAIAVMTLFGGAVKSKVITLIGAVTGNGALLDSGNNGMNRVSEGAVKEGRRKLDGMKIDSPDDVGIGSLP